MTLRILKEPLIKRTLRRIAALRPRSSLAYLLDMSRGLTVGRLALHPQFTLNQRFLNLFGTETPTVQ